MKRRIKILLIVVLLFIIFGIIDYNRVRNNSKPIFCIEIIDYNNLNKTCLGFGYKIQSQINVSSDQPFRKKEQIFGFWFTKKMKFKYERGNRHFLEIKSSSYNEPKLYYIDKNNIKYYLNNVEYVLINFDDESISLKSALENDKITMDEIISNLTLDKTYGGGFSTLYNDIEIEYSNGISILRCNTVNGNKDIYISNISFKYERNFCE